MNFDRGWIFHGEGLLPPGLPLLVFTPSIFALKCSNFEQDLLRCFIYEMGEKSRWDETLNEFYNKFSSSYYVANSSNMKYIGLLCLCIFTFSLKILFKLSSHFIGRVLFLLLLFNCSGLRFMVWALLKV